MDNFFESPGSELGQAVPLAGELFDFDAEFFNFEAACKEGAPTSEVFEGISPTFFEDACFLDKHVEKSSQSNQSSGNSFEVAETFGAIASDSVVAGNNVFVGLTHDPFDLNEVFDFEKLTNDEFLCLPGDVSMAEPTTTTQPATSTRPTPSKQPKTLTREAKVAKTPKKPKKAATPRKSVTPKKAVAPKKAATPKKGLPAIAPRERSLEELSNATWSSLTQKERERLLLPMIKGIDPVTVATASSPEASLTGSIVKSPSSDLTTRSVQTPITAPSTPASSFSPPTISFSSPWEALTMGIHTLTNDQIIENLLEIAVSEGLHMSGNKTTTTTPVLSKGPSNRPKVNMTKNNPGIQSANTVAMVANNNVVQSFGSTNVNATAPSQIFASPSSSTNNIIPEVFKIPMPPAMYGMTRQQEALKKHAQLQAEGRRR